MNDNIKFAAILSFMGQTRDRFQTWGPLYTLEEKVQRVAQVENLGAVEVVFPQEFEDVAYTKKLLDDAGLLHCECEYQGRPCLSHGRVDSF
jgi:hypothetical protein